MAVEVAVGPGGSADAFFEQARRGALSEMYGFPVVWHEQFHDISAKDGSDIVGALRIRIAASLGELRELIVSPSRRHQGIGSALLARAEELANYYNSHKMTVLVHAGSGAQRFFESRGYHLEATLPQHTFKLDVAVLRKFLL